MNWTGEAGRSFLPAGFTAAAVGAVLLAACENPEAPAMCGAIPEQSVVVGEAATVSACFEDANSDLLSHSASSSDPGVATVSIAGNTVTVTGVAPGTALVTITATDVTGLTGQQTFRVLVPNRTPVAVGEIEARDLAAGESGSVDVSAYFNEPDGQPLDYAMSVSDEGVLAISAAGAVVTFAARAKGSAAVTATATDPGGLSAVQSFVVTVPNRAPGAVGSMEPQTVEVDGTTSTDISTFFTDPDGDELVYAAASSDGAVAGVSISGGDLTVTAVAKGEATVTVTATDTEGLTATQAFLVTVPNRPPLATGTIEGRTIDVDGSATVELSGHFEDPDGDVLVYGAVTSAGAVAGVGVDGGVLTVTAVAKGEATVTVTATDTEGLTATQDFDVTVPNRPPLATGSIEGRTIEVGETATVDLSAHFSDPDGDDLVYTATASDPALIGASVEGAAATVTAVAKGEATVTVTATDTEGLTATQEFAVTVPNRPPQAVGSMADQTFEIGGSATLQLSGYFEDPDGDDLVYSVSSSDATIIGASVGGSAVTVEALAKGSAIITVTATDTEELAATQAFAVSVANRPPHAVGAIAAQTVEVDETATLELPGYFEDPDGDALVYAAATPDESVITLSTSGGTVTLTAVRKGEAVVTVTATDTDGMTATQAFVVTVPNRTPLAVGTIPEMEVSQGGIKRIDPLPHFTDPDGDELGFEAESSKLEVARAWMSVSGVVVRGVSDGTATVTIAARDPDGSTATLSFRVRVTGSDGGTDDPNNPPVATGKILGQELQEGDKRMLDASSYFSDPDNDELEFSASSSDVEVVKATTSGSEVELEVVAQGTATVTVTAEDPDGLGTSQDFGVAVTEAGTENRAPVAVGTIAAQSLDEDASTRLDASNYFTDPDSDALTFSAESSDPGVVTAAVSGNDLTLQAVAEGSATIVVTAEDPAGLSVELTFDVTVVAVTPNRAPVAGEIPAQRVRVDNSKTLDASLHFTDPDDDALTFTAVSSDTEVVTASVSGNDLELRAVAEGSATVIVTAEDPEGLSDSAEFQVTIVPPGNQPPRVTDQPRSLSFLKDAWFVDGLRFYFEDPDDDFSDLDYAVESSDRSVMTVVRVRPNLHRPGFRMTAIAEGEATITITVTDPGGLSASVSVVHTVGNNPPQIKNPPADIVRSPDETEIFFLQEFAFLHDVGIFEDNDIGDSMDFSVSSSNEAVATAVIEDEQFPWGTWTAKSLGEATITATATDEAGLTAEASFVITVTSNRPPKLIREIPDYDVDLPDSIVLAMSDHFEDPDGDSLSLEVRYDGLFEGYVYGDTLVITRADALVYVYATDPEGRYEADVFIAEVLEAQGMTSGSDLDEVPDHVREKRAIPVPVGRPSATRGTGSKRTPPSPPPPRTPSSACFT